MKLQTRTFWTLAAFVAIAFCVRLAWAYWTSPIPGTISDTGFYNAAAISIARGEGYSVLRAGGVGVSSVVPVSFAPGGDATAFWPPGFPLALGAMYAIFGENVAVARTTNVVIGALTVIPVYFIGRRLFGDSAGLAGAVIAAVLPSSVFWSPILFSETMFTFVFASAIAALLYSAADDGKLHLWPLVAAGILTGIAALVRGQGLVVLPLAAVWAALLGMRMRLALSMLSIMTVTAALVIAPWTFRNVVELNSPIILSTNFGYNLRIGHAPYSTGGLLEPRDLWEEEPGISFQERELLFNNLGTERAIRYALTHPADEIELTVRKIVGLWRPDAAVVNWAAISADATPLSTDTRAQLRRLVEASYIALLCLAGIGLLFRTAVRRSAIFVLSGIMLWTLVHVSFFGEPRFHVPILAIIAPASGAGLVVLLKLLSEERVQRWPVDNERDGDAGERRSK